jgi:hypothetical protein
LAICSRYPAYLLAIFSVRHGDKRGLLWLSLQINSSNISGHVCSSRSRLADCKPDDEIFQLRETTSAVKAVPLLLCCLTESLEAIRGSLCLLPRPHTLRTPLEAVKVSCGWNPPRGRNGVAGGGTHWQRCLDAMDSDKITTWFLFLARRLN